MSKSTIEQKVQKLLNLANDPQGSAEGIAAMDRAMKLMARYGISQRDLNDSKDESDLKEEVFNFPQGIKYAKQQSVLLGTIASSLGCFVLGQKTQYNKGVTSFRIYGKKENIERTIMLFSITSLTMIDAAMKAVPKSSSDIRRKRLSHMMGYAKAIGDLLSDQEDKARNASESKVVARIDDFNLAKKFAYDQVEGKVQYGSASRVDRNQFNRGYDEGKKFDVGNKSRISQTKALSA